MSWRLSQIGVYSKHTHEVHALEGLRAHGLNIITGVSGRGKSALIDIVNYCLMSGSCDVARGVIRDHVSHVAIVMSRGEEHRTVIRALPREGRATASEAAIFPSTTRLPARLPEMSGNAETVKEDISEFTGIEAVPLLTNEDAIDPDEQHPVNIRHCAPYLFQPQEVIGSKHVLFPWLQELYYKRHVADAASYFLNVMTVARLRERRRLRELVQERNRIHRRRREALDSRARGWERGVQLWGDAVTLGMLEGVGVPASEQSLFQDLQHVAHAEPTEIRQLVESLNLAEVHGREASLRQQLRERRFELSSIESFLARSEEHATVTDAQIDRLSLRDLIPTTRERECPLCGSDSLDASQLEAQLLHGLEKLAAVRAPPRRLKSKLESDAARLRKEIAAVTDELRSVQARLRIVFEDLKQSRSLLEESRRRERLIGRVREYLEAIQRHVGAPADDTAKLEEEINALESRVGTDAVRSLRRGVEGEIGATMANPASRLKVEFADRPMRINFESLTVQLRFDGPWVDLEEVGSAANHVGYHVSALAALHLYFGKVDCPVPRVLMIDQPSQAWFPPEIARERGLLAPEGEVELTAVRRVYQVLSDTANHQDGPQVIVTDHAKLADQFFRDATIADWRGPGGLVPEQWLGLPGA